MRRTALFALTGLVLFAPLLGAEDWNQLNPPNSPEERFGHSMVTLSDGRVLLFGGENATGHPLYDLHIFHGNEWSEVTPTNNRPAPRYGHTGGPNPEDDLRRLDPDGSYTHLGDSPYVSPSDPTAVSLADVLYIFGGIDLVAMYRIATGEWSHSEPSLPLRGGSTSMVTSQGGHDVISLFGGWTDSGASGVVYEYDTVTGEVSACPTPSPSTPALGSPPASRPRRPRVRPPRRGPAVGSSSSSAGSATGW